MSQYRRSKSTFQQFHPLIILVIGGIILGVLSVLESRLSNGHFQQIVHGVFQFFYVAVIAIFGSLAVAAEIRRRDRKRLLDVQTGLASIRAMPWDRFEYMIGEAFRRQGYRVTEHGGGGADGGIDLILHRKGTTTLVQAKRWNQQRVGVPVVREMYGVLMDRKADQFIIVSSGSFTRDAYDFAQGKPITLVDGKELYELIQSVQTPGASAPSPNTCTADDQPPICPACGSGMVQRTARKGRNRGKTFWGCSRYPLCRGILSLKP